MSVNLTDQYILICYNEIIQNNGKDWLILSYGLSRDRLSVLASGVGNLDDLRQHVPRADVCFGFCRERDGERSYFALITFVPESVPGVKRARALVHSRAVHSLFKTANVSLSVNNVDSITVDQLRDRLQLGPSMIAHPATAGIQRSTTLPSELHLAGESARAIGARQNSSRMRTVTSDDPRRVAMMPPRPYPNSRRMPYEFGETAAPPPIPPKDGPYNSSAAFAAASLPDRIVRRTTSDSAGNSELRPRAYATENQRKWASLSPKPMPRVLSPEERARIRLEAQKQREEEERIALREEEEHQARLKREKEEILEQEQEEEERRLAKLAEEKRQAQAARERREREAQVEEERRKREREEKAMQERERRTKLEMIIEQEKKEAERRAAEAERRRDDRLSEQLKRKERMKEIQAKLKARNGANIVFLTGVVTVQTSTSISWKRRYFELTEKALVFYRNSQDRGAALDIMSLADRRVSAIKDPSEGYDELEAIPYSFAVEFSDGEGPWSMFCDNTEDKEALVGLLSQIAEQ